MQRTTFWLVLILIAAGFQLLSRMAPSPKQAKTIPPASVSTLEGTDRMRLTLLPEAARRLDIQTALVREEPVGRTRKFPGEVISISADLNIAIVEVELTQKDARMVRRDEPAFVLPLARGSKALRIKTVPVNESNTLGLHGPPGILYYETSSGDHGLVSRQLVFVDLPLAAGGTKRKLIPYAALLYDAQGNTWVYTNPEPLVFFRERIFIDKLVGDEVVLSDGPPAGTAVVTTGGAELYGTEVGVGK